MKKFISSKKMFSFLLVLSLSVFISCDVNSPNAGDSGKYFPMQIGNKWYYAPDSYSSNFDSTNINEIWTVADTKYIDGIQFYVINCFYITYDYSYSYVLYYNPNVNILYEYIDNGQESPYITPKAKFNLNVNDKFEYINGLNYNVSVISKNWPYMSFYYDDPQVYDEEYSITFKEGIGIYKWISGWGIGERLVKSELK